MKPPGPNLIQMAKDLPLIWSDRLAWMKKLQAEYGDVVQIPFGLRTSYAVFHPDHIRHVLVGNSKNYWKGRTFEKTSAYLGKGLATSEGAAWQVQRRRMNPSFMRETLASLSDIMVASIEKMLTRWEEIERTEQTVDVSLEFQRLAMEVVARSLFGSEVPESEIHNIIQAFKTALQFTTRRTLLPIDIPEKWPLPSNIEFKKAIAYLDSIVYRILETEKAKDPHSKTLLSMLLMSQDPETGEFMSDQQIRDEVMTMFLGGTDTSGNTLSWVLVLLQKHPEVKSKLEEEVRRVLSDRAPTAAELMQFPFLRAVVEETLRLYPQNWVMSRDTLEEDQIGGFTIPKDSTVFIGVYLAHRRPDFWKDAESFQPERFLQENSAGRHPTSYLPFGAGPRKCIGFQFAMMEFTFALTLLLQRYDFQVTNISGKDAIEPYATWSMWPTPGVFVKLRKRK